MYLRPAHCHLHLVLHDLHGRLRRILRRRRPVLKGNDMALFMPIAEVLDPELFSGLPEAQRPNGESAEEVLLRADAADFVDVPVPASMREQLRSLATSMGDDLLAQAAEVQFRRVSVAHFRTLAPQSRVLVGIRVKYTEAESRFLKDR